MTQSIAQSWDAYWCGSQRDVAFSSGGTSHPTILTFWDDFFASVEKRFSDPRIVDVASGNGAIVSRAISNSRRKPEEFTCLDASLSAMKSLTARAPGVCGVVADARAIPLASSAYDIATSQFGVEYAGRSAIDEVSRLVGTGGQIALLLHILGGGIHKQCTASRNAIDEIRRCDVVAKSSDLFNAIFAARNRQNQAVLDEAVRQFTPAIQIVESVIRKHGKDVADGTVARLYVDIRTIHERITNYDRTEVLSWLCKMDHELFAYQGRMKSMCNAALSPIAFDQLCAQIETHGFVFTCREPLTNSANNVPLAWALVATRG